MCDIHGCTKYKVVAGRISIFSLKLRCMFFFLFFFYLVCKCLCIVSCIGLFMHVCCLNFNKVSVVLVLVSWVTYDEDRILLLRSFISFCQSGALRCLKSYKFFCSRSTWSFMSTSCVSSCLSLSAARLSSSCVLATASFVCFSCWVTCFSCSVSTRTRVDTADTLTTTHKVIK